MEKQINKTSARAFAAEFATALEAAMKRLTGSSWPFQVTTATTPQQRRPLHFRLKVEGSLCGECFVEFYEPHASAVAAALLGRPAENEEAAGQLQTVLDSTIRELQSKLAVQYGELALSIEHVTSLAYGGMFVVPLATAADPSAPALLLYFDTQFLASLSGLASAGNGQEGAMAFETSNLKLLMDVELNVSLRFGQRRLSLREVLELSSGSVVELDRMVDEPVELLLNGKVIARGEAVIVDDNYGLRVTEISEPLPSHFLN